MCNFSPVPFHGDTIYCVELNGQPYTPMKPIVENLGLQWGAQTIKLNTNKARWGVSMIEIPSNGGVQEMLCLPVRKLPAWLASINPRKVKPELRAKIELYQNECDDALWDYWMTGQAVRNQPRYNDQADFKKELEEYIENSVQKNLTAIESFAAELAGGVINEAIEKLEDIRSRIQRKRPQNKPFFSTRLDEKQKTFGKFVTANQEFFSTPRTVLQMIKHGFKLSCRHQDFGNWLRNQGFDYTKSKGYPAHFLIGALEPWKGLAGYEELWANSVKDN